MRLPDLAKLVLVVCLLLISCDESSDESRAPLVSGTVRDTGGVPIEGVGIHTVYVLTPLSPAAEATGASGEYEEVRQ